MQKKDDRQPAEPPRKRRKRVGDILRSAGFDLSYKTPEGYRVRCSQCEAMTIQGVPIHEKGCPNEGKSH